jgi:hypothetical protein
MSYFFLAFALVVGTATAHQPISILARHPVVYTYGPMVPLGTPIDLDDVSPKPNIPLILKKTPSLPPHSARPHSVIEPAPFEKEELTFADWVNREGYLDPLSSFYEDTMKWLWDFARALSLFLEADAIPFIQSLKSFSHDFFEALFGVDLFGIGQVNATRNYEDVINAVSRIIRDFRFRQALGMTYRAR